MKRKTRYEAWGCKIVEIRKQILSSLKHTFVKDTQSTEDQFNRIARDQHEKKVNLGYSSETGMM